MITTVRFSYLRVLKYFNRLYLAEWFKKNIIKKSLLHQHYRMIYNGVSGVSGVSGKVRGSNPPIAKFYIVNNKNKNNNYLNVSNPHE